MTPLSCSWLLRLAALCHLTILLAGQHHGVKKCRITCNKMTSRIPVANLFRYEQNHESCGKRAIILETRRHKLFCADPAEKWVQEAMAQLDRRAAALTQNGGTFEKQIGVGEPRTTPATRGMYQYAVSEADATGESSSLELTPSQEAQRALGTSPGLPTGVAGSSGTRSPSASKAEGEGPPAGPEVTELLTVAAISTTISTAVEGQSSTASQPGAGLWADGGASEVPSEVPSTEAPSSQGPSIEAPTISYSAPEDNVGSEGQPVWVKEQSPMPENSPESEEMGPITAHTDAFLDWGPGSTAHASVVSVSSDEAPSREPGTEGSWASKAEEPIHATMDPQRLGVIITPVPDSQAATRRQAVGLLAFLGLLFCLGVAMFAYQSLQGCSRKMAGEMVDGLRYVPRSCGSNSYVLVPV
ncbi:fractalkine [Orycteropus afer afer]|uniref:Fractalkine n=1 Tax=Orycteropus afer afer TaxID=1230840 RepID=A0A8B7ACD0_ORYAF|nr:fractalkine [Orycteropus afer afer]